MSDCGETTYYPIEPYATVEDLCAPCNKVDLDPDSEDNQIELFNTKLLLASRRVFIATGGRWSGCITTKWMPGCREAWPCCGGTGGCGCGDEDYVELPDGAVRSIIAVKIDGTTIAAGKYRLEGRRLYRTDGERWPDEQTSGVDDTIEGSWSIEYRYGIDVPPEAKPLIASYACELVKGCSPGGNCQVRNGYREITIGGALYVMPDPVDYRTRLLTGYDPLDDWISAIMANHARTRPRLAGRRPRGHRA